jgi:hypothetical protein
MVRKMLILSEELAERVSDFRFSNRITSYQEAVRLLLECGLNGREKNDSGSNVKKLRQDQA